MNSDWHLLVDSRVSHLRTHAEKGHQTVKSKRVISTGSAGVGIICILLSALNVKVMKFKSVQINGAGPCNLCRVRWVGGVLAPHERMGSFILPSLSQTVQLLHAGSDVND